MSSPLESTPPDFSSRLFIKNMSMKQFNFFTGTVLFISGVIFILACMCPTPHLIRPHPISECDPQIFGQLGLTCDPFSLDKNPVALITIENLAPHNKFVALNLLPFKTPSNSNSNVKLKLMVSAYSAKDKGPLKVVFEPDTMELGLDCSKSRSPDCGPHNVLALSYSKERVYYIVVKITNNQEMIPLLKDFTFSTTTMELDFKNYVFFAKLSFLIVSVVGYLFYLIKTFRMKKEYFSNELKSVEALFPFLLLINEPFTSQLIGGMVYSWIITAGLTIFSARQVKQWVQTAQELAGPDASIYPLDDSALKIGMLVYGALVWKTYDVFHGALAGDPGKGFLLEFGLHFTALRLPLFVVLGLIVFYMVRCCQVIRRKSDAGNEREFYYVWFSAFFCVAHIVLVGSGGLSPISHDGPKMLLFSGLSTLYMLSASYLYLPNKSAGVQSQGAGSKPGDLRTKLAYAQLDDSHDFAPQTGNQGNMAGKGNGKAGGDFMQENYPPEHKVDDIF